MLSSEGYSLVHCGFAEELRWFYALSIARLAAVNEVIAIQLQ